MAHKVNLLYEQDPESNYLVIAGMGHLQHNMGVPERIFAKFPNLIDESALIVSYESDETIDTFASEQEILAGIESNYGPPGANPADYLYIYEDPANNDYDDEEEQKASEVKNETADAYNKVGETASNPGNLKKAWKVMSYLGYNED